MASGRISFCCGKADCPVSIKIAEIIFEFVKIQISFKDNCSMQINLSAFAFDKATVDSFKRMYVILSDDKKRMKIDPRISRSTFPGGDIYTNVFE